jgi:site-specific DNA-methyltransferase (adenine-specific)
VSLKIDPTLELEAAAVWVPINSLREWEGNPRVNDHAVARVADSIKRWGFGAPILARRANREIVAGHTRLKAARLLGLDRVPVRFLDLDPAEARLLALADNRLGELAEWDTDKLAELLRVCTPDDALLAGWNADELDALLAGAAGADTLPPDYGDPDAVPDLPADPETRPGDVWRLGRHRLVCGDSGDPRTLDALLQGETVRCVFTDPPYNVAGETGVARSRLTSSSGPRGRALTDAGWDRGFDIAAALQQIERVLGPDASVYVCTSQHLAGEIWAWMAAWSVLHGWCVWYKPAPMPSLAKRHWTWSAELICYATRGKHTFNFPDEGHAPNVWTIGRKACDTDHPTEKPVAVPAHAITHSSSPGDLVLDLFGGSGSTLIACEQQGRCARVAEISPAYCDVIARRWELFTGGEAERVAGGAR